MKKFTKLTGLMFVAAIMTFTFSSESQAVPAFARQVGVSCTTCHFQHYPALNAFGRAFKANGYTMIGSQAKIEDEGLSLPDTLNASIITKIRYQKTNGDSKAGTDKGELQFPDEAALFMGGRVAENIGFALEAGLNASADPGATMFTSFKMPVVVYDGGSIKASIIPFTTDGLGASFGFELLNTGAVRNIRTFEERGAISAQQYVDTSGAAEGFAFVAASDMFFVNATLWGPAHGTVDTGLDLSHYVRAAVTPNVGGWDLGAGIQYWGGETKVGDTASIPSQIYVTNAMAVDAQAQGAVGSMPLGVYLSWANAPEADTGSAKTNLFNSSTTDAISAIALSAELGVVPNKATVGAGYRAGTDGAGDSDNAIMIGATYQVALNVQLQLNHQIESGDAHPSGTADQKTTLMLFSGF